MSDRLCDCAVCICIQCFMCLYLPECCICTDSKLVLILINLVKSEIAQINCRAKRLIFHFEPEHAAQHKIRFFLIKLISFIKALRPHILIVIKHIFLLLSCYIGNYQLPHFDFIHRFPPDVMLLHKGYEALPVRKLCSPCQPAARRYDRRKRNCASRNTTCLALDIKLQRCCGSLEGDD